MDIQQKEETIEDIHVILSLKIFSLKSYQDYPVREKLIFKIELILGA